MPKHPFEERDGKKAMQLEILLQRAKEGMDFIRGSDSGEYATTPWSLGEREQLMSLWNIIYKGNSALASARSPIHDNWLYVIAAKDLLTQGESHEESNIT